MDLLSKKANKGRLRLGLLLPLFLLMISFAGCSGEEAAASPEIKELQLSDMDLSGDWAGDFIMTSHNMASLPPDEVEGCEEEFGVAIAEVLVKQFDALIDQPLSLKLNFMKTQDAYSGAGSLRIPAKLIIASNPEGADEDAVNEFQSFTATVENNELHFSVGVEETSLVFIGKAVKESTLEGTFKWNNQETTFAEGTWRIVKQ